MMKTSAWIITTNVVVFSHTFQICSACSSDDKEDSGCWYTLWYIWFVLGLFVVVIAVLVILYIKHRTKERSRARRRRRSTRTVPIHLPTGPPGSQNLVKPPSMMKHRGKNPSTTFPGHSYYNVTMGPAPSK
ncbi:uncharacterized protein LOC132740194 [Ruditapes philippinarum]|uniref:uncharacterized protein LOC132740194 n=1 Tax=Ruditapes philippinarum TaxID=129788 RepID=UPI00295AAD32|nr:uncharacterized protein LOC132740194 [Ruditapes philippinarum]